MKNKWAGCTGDCKGHPFNCSEHPFNCPCTQLNMNSVKEYLETKARMGDIEARKFLGHCLKCNDTGKLFGAQRQVNVKGEEIGYLEYYTADCDCISKP